MCMKERDRWGGERDISLLAHSYHHDYSINIYTDIP